MATRDLSGRLVAVIGASGGLGSPLCDALRRHGADVVTAGRADTDDVRVDVRDSAGADAVVEHVQHIGRQLDGVVIVAGVVAFGDLAATDDVIVEELLLTNSMGPLWIAKRVRPLLADSQGFLVNVSGVIAETPMPAMVAYAASKAAASAGMVALAKEWRRSKIHVIDARPPHTETGLATRPLQGVAPNFATGLQPAAVAERIVVAIENGERELSGADFGNGDSGS